MSINNIRIRFDSAVNNYSNIKYLMNNKIHNPTLSKIQTNISEFRKIFEIIENHISELNLNDNKVEYVSWCSEIKQKINDIISKLESFQDKILNYKTEINKTLEFLIGKKTKVLEHNIQEKFKTPVEWYQVIDNNNNYEHIFMNLIQSLLYPNLYRVNNINNRKLLLSGRKHMGKYFFAQAIVTQLLKINSNYNVLIIDSNNLNYNSNNINFDQHNVNQDLNNLIILVHNIEQNKETFDKYYNILEKSKPLWIITSTEQNNDQYEPDIHLQFNNLSFESAISIIKSLISNYLVNDNQYHLMFEPLQKRLYCDNEIIKQLSKLYQSRYKYLCEYDISLLDNMNIFKNIGNRIVKDNLNIQEILKIMLNSFNTTGKVSIQYNTYCKHNEEFLSTLSLQKLTSPKYFLKKPEYFELTLNDNGSGKLCNKCGNNCKKTQKYVHLDILDMPLKLEHERITDYFILEEQISELNDKTCLDLICRIPWIITNKINYKIVEYSLSVICLNFYNSIIHSIISNNQYQDLTEFNKKINDFKKIHKIEDLDTELTVDERDTYFSISHDTNNMMDKCGKESQSILILSEQESFYFNITFNKKCSSDILTYKDGISNEINLLDLRKILTYLIDEELSKDEFDNINLEESEFDIQIIYINGNNSYLWEIDFYSKIDNNKKIKLDLDEYLEVKSSDQDIKIEVSNYITISPVKLDEDYKLTIPHNLDLLQQKFTDEFKDMDREDLSTWHNKVIQPKHIEYLNSEYDDTVRYCLYLLNYLNTYYHQGNESIELESLITIITSKIYERLEIDNMNEDDDDELSVKFHISDNHFDLLYSEHNNNSLKINVLYFNLCINIFKPYKMLNKGDLSSMFDLFNSVNKQHFVHKDIDIYVKTNLDLSKQDIKKCYYSYYCSNKFNELMEYDKFSKTNRVLLNRISNNSSLLYLLMNNCTAIGIRNNNDIVNFYPINHKNWIENISLNNNEITFKDINSVIEKNIKELGIQNKLALLLSSVYSNSYGVNPTNIYIASLLSYPKYITHRPNSDLTSNTNIFEFVNIDIQSIDSLSTYFSTIDLPQNIGDKIDFSHNTLIDKQIIITGSLNKKSQTYDISDQQILTSEQEKKISSSSLRTEYILDELI